MQSIQIRNIRLTDNVVLELPKDSKILKAETLKQNQNYTIRQNITLTILGSFENRKKFKKVIFKIFGNREEIDNEFLDGYLNTFTMFNAAKLHLFTNCNYILTTPIKSKKKTTRK